MDLDHKFCSTFMRSVVYCAEIHVLILTICNASLNIIDFEKKSGCFLKFVKALWQKVPGNRKKTLSMPFWRAKEEVQFCQNLVLTPDRKIHEKPIVLKLLVIPLIIANKKVTKNEAIAKHWIIRTKSWNNTQLRNIKLLIVVIGVGALISTVISQL